MQLPCQLTREAMLMHSIMVKESSLFAPHARSYFFSKDFSIDINLSPIISLCNQEAKLLAQLTVQ